MVGVLFVQWALFTMTAFVPKLFDVKLKFLLYRMHFLHNKASGAYQNDFIKNFAIIVTAIIKRADCIWVCCNSP